MKLIRNFVVYARYTEGLEFSRSGHLSVEIDSDFSPSVDRGSMI